MSYAVSEISAKRLTAVSEISAKRLTVSTRSLLCRMFYMMYVMLVGCSALLWGGLVRRFGLNELNYTACQHASGCVDQTVDHRFKSPLTNGPRFTATSLPWWSPIQSLPEVLTLAWSCWNCLAIEHQLRSVLSALTSVGLHPAQNVMICACCDTSSNVTHF